MLLRWPQRCASRCRWLRETAPDRRICNAVTAMTQRPLQQVDVFTATPYRGNPPAVVLQANSLVAPRMTRRMKENIT